MSSKVKVDRAHPLIEQAGNAEAIVVEGEAAVAGVEASPHYNDPAAADVQGKTKSYAAAILALKANNTAKQNGRIMLEQATTAEPVLIRRVGTQRRGLTNAIEAFADGSKDVALTFVKKLEEKHAAPDATTPENLRPFKHPKHADAACRWDPSPGAEGYLVQHCTNTADASTYSAALHSTEAKFHLLGQTAGTTIYFRVAALDKKLPGGQTEWTVWVGVFVV
jgi:hypothetical protein